MATLSMIYRDPVASGGTTSDVTYFSSCVKYVTDYCFHTYQWRFETVISTCLTLTACYFSNWNHIEVRCNITKHEFCVLSEADPVLSLQVELPSDSDTSVNNTEDSTILPEVATRMDFEKCNENFIQKRAMWICLLVICSILLVLECKYLWRVSKMMIRCHQSSVSFDLIVHSMKNAYTG